jgi:hypothetical protein
MSGPDYADRPELALVALLSMLSRFPQARCATMAQSIVEHLGYIAGDDRYPAPLRGEALRVSGQWRLLARETEGDERSVDALALRARGLRGH